MKLVKSVATFCVGAVGLLGGAALGAIIDTVPVGDPGNAPDTRYSSPGFGSVAYPYHIGKYEVTAGQYAEFLNKVAATDTYGLYNTHMSRTDYGSGISRNGSSGSYTYSVDSAFVNRPVNYVSYWDACRFTNWLSKGQPTGAQGAGTTERGTYTLDGYNGSDGRTIQRNPGSTWALPSEDEWYKAAYYKGGSTNAGYWGYPTSSDIAPGRDLNDASGNNANYFGEGPIPIEPPYHTTMVGQFKNSASPYGTFDQGGNVWERNEAVTYDITWVHRGLRGGSFSDFEDYMRASNRAEYDMTAEYSWHGFRVSLVPEPTCLALLAVGGIGMLIRRRGLGR